MFQSTLPRRERRIFDRHFSDLLSFNPRSREGSDDRYELRWRKLRVSIHAPAKGATGMAGRQSV